MNSGSTGSQRLDLLIAGMVLAFIFFLILRNWQSIKAGIAIVGVIGVGLGLAFFALVSCCLLGSYRAGRSSCLPECCVALL